MTRNLSADYEGTSRRGPQVPSGDDEPARQLLIQGASSDCSVSSVASHG